MSPWVSLVVAALTSCVVSQPGCDSNGAPIGPANGRQGWRNQGGWGPKPVEFDNFCTTQSSVSVRKEYTYTDNRMTHARCWRHCKQNAMSVAIMRDGGTCECGFWTTRVTVGKSYCNTPCRGNSQDNCGGQGGTYVTALVTKSGNQGGSPGNQNGGPGNQGGWPGNQGGSPGNQGGWPGNQGGSPGNQGGWPGNQGGSPGNRNEYQTFCTTSGSVGVRKEYNYTDNRMTHARCWRHCKQNAMSVAIMKNGGTCECGFWTTRVTVGQSYCNTPCRGNSQDNCGGQGGTYVTALAY